MAGGLFDVPEPLPSFDAFWAAYPRKIKREAAKKAWLKLNPTAQLAAKMIIAIEAQKAAQYADRAPEHIPHGSTWINGKQWEDAIELRRSAKIHDLGGLQDHGDLGRFVKRAGS